MRFTLCNFLLQSVSARAPASLKTHGEAVFGKPGLIQLGEVTSEGTNCRTSEHEAKSAIANCSFASPHWMSSQESVIPMPLKRVTMQDIANACGLSRNTVSKVFNNRGSVPESTKNLVISAARELGYYQYTLEGTATETGGGNIALLAQHKFLSHFFGTLKVLSEMHLLGFLEIHYIRVEYLVMPRSVLFIYKYPDVSEQQHA